MTSRYAGALLFVVALSSCSSESGSGDTDTNAGSDTDGDTDTDAEDQPPAIGDVCGGPDTYWEPGQRLRPVVHRPDNGAPILAAWFDNELDVECSFTTASDGVLRCLPGGALSTTIQDDPACDRELASRHPWEDIGTYGAVHECSGTEVVELGPLFEMPTSDDEAQGCHPAQYSGMYQVVLGVVPPETFVSATHDREATGSTLERRILRSDDGACSYVSGWDSQAGGEVGVSPDEEGTMRLVPPTGYALNRVGDREMYGSPDCTGQLVGEDQCHHPPFAAETLAECGWASTRKRFYRTEGAIDAQSVYGLGDDCSLVSSYPKDRYFYLGDPEPSSTFPPATAQLGEGRLQRRIHALPDGTALQVDTEYWDDDLQTLCTPVDGRCVPKFELIVRFADEACTQPRLVYSTTGCPTIPKWASANTLPRQVYTVVPGDPDETTTTFYVLDGGLNCNLAVDVEPDEIVLPAQGPVDRGMFAAVERVVE